MSTEIVVADNPQSDRYEIDVDGERVGFVTYRRSPGLITFLHAEVDPARERRGYGSRLVRAALDDARAHELAVAPRCPFVAAFIRDHSEEYGDLLA